MAQIPPSLSPQPSHNLDRFNDNLSEQSERSNSLQGGVDDKPITKVVDKRITIEVWGAGNSYDERGNESFSENTKLSTVTLTVPKELLKQFSKYTSDGKKIPSYITALIDAKPNDTIPMKATDANEAAFVVMKYQSAKLKGIYKANNLQENGASVVPKEISKKVDQLRNVTIFQTTSEINNVIDQKIEQEFKSLDVLVRSQIKPTLFKIRKNLELSEKCKKNNDQNGVKYHNDIAEDEKNKENNCRVLEDNISERAKQARSLSSYGDFDGIKKLLFQTVDEINNYVHIDILGADNFKNDFPLLAALRRKYSNEPKASVSSQQPEVEQAKKRSDSNASWQSVQSDSQHSKNSNDYWHVRSNSKSSNSESSSASNSESLSTSSSGSSSSNISKLSEANKSVNHIQQQTRITVASVSFDDSDDSSSNDTDEKPSPASHRQRASSIASNSASDQQQEMNDHFRTGSSADLSPFSPLENPGNITPFNGILNGNENFRFTDQEFEFFSQRSPDSNINIKNKEYSEIDDNYYNNNDAIIHPHINKNYDNNIKNNHQSQVSVAHIAPRASTDLNYDLETARKIHLKHQLIRLHERYLDIREKIETLQVISDSKSEAHTWGKNSLNSLIEIEKDVIGLSGISIDSIDTAELLKIVNKAYGENYKDYNHYYNTVNNIENVESIYNNDLYNNASEIERIDRQKTIITVDPSHADVAFSLNGIIAYIEAEIQDYV
jgi:hypothetical protein